MTTSPFRPEVLAPAGSPEALTAALRCGADAVYLGGSRFNARENAAHFSGDALGEAADACHARGARLYLALNTLLRQEELSAALELAEQACAQRVDALILQDTGLARRLHAAVPGLPLHASTQLSCHTPAGVRELRDAGFTRVVLAREMSREEIASCAGQGCELEVFVHGALCMSVSGQCLLSAVLGGRSGNRGLCAQPCRLPFRADGPGKPPGPEDAALSLRDLCLRRYVEELAAAGVASLKIEGRMKRPEYVAAAVSTYAAAVRGEDTSGLEQDLQSVFSRSGFTDGYYISQRGGAMFGFRRKEDVAAAAPVLGRLAGLYHKETPRVPVDLSLTVESGRPCRLTIRDREGHAAVVEGPVPESARNAPLDPSRAEGALRKTGGTPYHAETVTASVGPGLALPLAALNALRREALERLTEERIRRTPPAFHQRALPVAPIPSVYAPLERKRGTPFRLAARCRTAAQAEAMLSVPEPPSLLIVPLSLPEETLRRLAAAGPTAVEIPRGLFGREETVRRRLEIACRAGVGAALCGNIGALPLAREAKLAPLGGFGLNVTNAEAAAFYAERGMAALTLSPELAFHQLPSSPSLPTGLLIYGRQPLMLTRNCPLRAAAEQKGTAVPCPSCGGNGRLIDRKGVAFPVTCEDGPGSCTEVLNSLPLYWADQLDKLPEVDFLLLHFTGESPEEAAELLCRHRGGGPPPDGFTRGLYRRGVH